MQTLIKTSFSGFNIIFKIAQWQTVDVNAIGLPEYIVMGFTCEGFIKVA